MSLVMVDELRVWPTKIRCFKAGSCHLTVDGSIDDLHTFAASIGLKREWFQEHSIAPHYDLTAARRRDAIEAGAVFVPARQQVIARRERELR